MTPRAHVLFNTISLLRLDLQAISTPDAPFSCSFRQNTIGSMEQLADLLREDGRAEEAEELEREVAYLQYDAESTVD